MACSWSSLIDSTSAPVSTLSPSDIMPRLEAMAPAVILWSPVIITGLMPAALHLATATFASSRGGSIIPTIPRKVRSFSRVAGVISEGSSFRALEATASTRRACEAIFRLASWIPCRSSSSRGRAPCPSSMFEQHPSSSSSPPFTATRKVPSGRACTVVISFLSESKGISSTRGSPASISFLSREYFRPASRSAVSVGSPIVLAPSSPFLSTASLARIEVLSISLATGLSYPTSCREPSTKSFVTVILFWVRVPVLSEHITVVLPRVSTEGRLRTMAFCLASLCTPSASTTVDTAGRPSGMAATASDTAVMNMSMRFLP